MTPGRYVRLVRGQLICSRTDLQGVIAHLHDLARHLDGLMPDEDALDRLTRSRDYAGGFAERAAYEKALDAAVLESLADRPANASYEPLAIEGYSAEQIDSSVYRLWKSGHVDAHTTKPNMVTPSALTTKGFKALRREKVGA